VTETVSTAAPQHRNVAWGRETETASVQGHPALVYSDRPRSVADFLLTARRWRGREFLVQGDRRITYEKHEAAVAAVAARLREQGSGPGSRVGLLGFNSIEWVVAYWAVHAVGATVVLGNA
jgi:long-chain acyl-CoA synthetase